MDELKTLKKRYAFSWIEKFILRLTFVQNKFFLFFFSSALIIFSLSPLFLSVARSTQSNITRFAGEVSLDNYEDFQEIPKFIIHAMGQSEEKVEFIKKNFLDFIYAVTIGFLGFVLPLIFSLITFLDERSGNHSAIKIYQHLSGALFLFISNIYLLLFVSIIYFWEPQLNNIASALSLLIYLWFILNAAVSINFFLKSFGFTRAEYIIESQKKYLNYLKIKNKFNTFNKFLIKTKQTLKTNWFNYIFGEIKILQSRLKEKNDAQFNEFLEKITNDFSNKIDHAIQLNFLKSYGTLLKAYFELFKYALQLIEQPKRNIYYLCLIDWLHIKNKVKIILSLNEPSFFLILCNEISYLKENINVSGDTLSMQRVFAIQLEVSSSILNQSVQMALQQGKEPYSTTGYQLHGLNKTILENALRQLTCILWENETSPDLHEDVIKRLPTTNTIAKDTCLYHLRLLSNFIFEIINTGDFLTCKYFLDSLKDWMTIQFKKYFESKNLRRLALQLNKEEPELSSLEVDSLTSLLIDIQDYWVDYFWSVAKGILFLLEHSKFKNFLLLNVLHELFKDKQHLTFKNLCYEKKSALPELLKHLSRENNILQINENLRITLAGLLFHSSLLPNRTQTFTVTFNINQYLYILICIAYFDYQQTGANAELLFKKFPQINFEDLFKNIKKINLKEWECFFSIMIPNFKNQILEDSRNELISLLKKYFFSSGEVTT